MKNKQYNRTRGKKIHFAQKKICDLINICIIFVIFQNYINMFGRRIKYSISLSYLKFLNQRNRTMVVHHGLMGSSRNFRSIVKHPSISNYVDSYLIDCRNHGESPHTSSHTMSDLADDLYQFIGQQKQKGESNWERITLMGHSMGGLALMEFTKRYPQMQKYVDRVIIVDISPSKINGDPKWENTKKMLSKMDSIPLNQTPQVVMAKIDQYAVSKDIAGLIKMNLQVGQKGKMTWKPNLSLLVKNYDNIEGYQLSQTSWRKPIDIIYGSLSNHVNDKEIQNYLNYYPHMSKMDNFHKVEGAGHWVHFDKTKEFLQIIQKILKRDE